MKKSKPILLLCTILVLMSSILYVVAIKRPSVPVLLQRLDVDVIDITTQKVYYDTDNANEPVARELRTYQTNTGEAFTFDESGDLTMYVAPVKESSTITDTLEPAQITKSLVYGLLDELVSDITEFSPSSLPANTEYGYELVLNKNPGTPAEDTLILRLHEDGTIKSFNLNRSGFEADEIDVAYFQGEADKIILDHRDTAVETNFAYRKLGGKIHAFCSIVFVDEFGGRYVETYTFT